MKCKNCETELTFMEKSKCLRCLKCHPVTEFVPPKGKETAYVDVPWTEERILALIEKRVREVVQDEMENWYIKGQDVDSEQDIANTVIDRVAPRQPDNPPKGWRAQAKELGVPLNKETGGSRKKIDVLKDIEDKLKVPV